MRDFFKKGLTEFIESLSRKRARVHIWCSLDRNIPSPILMGEGEGEGNFIFCGRAKIMNHFVVSNL